MPHSGPLQKYTNWASGYQPRYFQINNSTSRLEYYLTEQECFDRNVTPRGGVTLYRANCFPDLESSTAFQIISEKEIFRLKAGSTKERLKWILEIKKCSLEASSDSTSNTNINSKPSKNSKNKSKSTKLNKEKSKTLPPNLNPSSVSTKNHDNTLPMIKINSLTFQQDFNDDYSRVQGHDDNSNSSIVRKVQKCKDGISENVRRVDGCCFGIDDKISNPRNPKESFHTPIHQNSLSNSTPSLIPSTNSTNLFKLKIFLESLKSKMVENVILNDNLLELNLKVEEERGRKGSSNVTNGCKLSSNSFNNDGRPSKHLSRNTNTSHSLKILSTQSQTSSGSNTLPPRVQRISISNPSHYISKDQTQAIPSIANSYVYKSKHSNVHSSTEKEIFKMKQVVSDSIGNSLKAIGLTRTTGKLDIGDQMCGPSVRQNV